MAARHFVLCVLAAALLPACGDPWVETEVGELRRLSLEAMSGPGGRVRVKVPVEEGESAMLFTVDAEFGHMGVFISAESPSGTEVWELDAEWDSGRYKSGARYATEVVSLNWPIIQGDAPLEPGDWKILVGLVDNELVYQRGIDAELDVVLKRDPDLSGGMLSVRVVFAGDTADDPVVRPAMDEALDQWVAIYASFGVTLDLSFGTWPDDDLAQPGQGTDDVYAAIADETPLGALTLVVVPSLRDSPDVYGVSGGIPGPLVPTSRSVVAVAALLHAGPNLAFETSEVQILAETMAHEAGHYVGLFHPVERSWSEWDAIADTPECESESECVTALRDNLMFPYPVCGNQGCGTQHDLTPGQQALLHRYVGVH